MDFYYISPECVQRKASMSFCHLRDENTQLLQYFLTPGRKKRGCFSVTSRLTVGDTIVKQRNILDESLFVLPPPGLCLAERCVPGNTLLAVARCNASCVTSVRQMWRGQTGRTPAVPNGPSADERRPFFDSLKAGCQTLSQSDSY